jgi:hypothetical protein
MRNFLTALLLVSFALSASVVHSVSGQGFHPACENNLPFQLKALKKIEPIDSSCDLDGEGGAASLLQNSVKNDFCATGSPIRVTHNTFFLLEGRIEKRLASMGIKWGTPTQLPSSRDMLDDVLTVGGMSLGEGKVVRYVGYVIDAHHSNVSDGENVNCSEKGEINNDIHIALGPNAGTDPCDTITAEISPHFRPDSWNNFDNFWILNPVRITGQLFFDASHKPCTPGHKVRPPRLSSWEIHPVYAIDVCKNSSLGGCPVGDDSKWTPFDVWVTLPDDKEEGR